MPLQNTFIVSVPRSGSTLLTNLLDAYEDVVCPPESFFPAVLEMLDPADLSEKRKIAALFVVSCSDGSPLTVQEAEACILPDKGRTLDALALAIAAKMGRSPSAITAVVWKYTRMVGCWRFPVAHGGRFIILHRNLLNVYESQFRVPFGEKNKNPVRFALFSSSYAVAFAEYPADQTLELEYPEIPARMPELVAWIGSAGRKREASAGTLDEIAGKNPWHANINKPFENKDPEKLKNLAGWQTAGFYFGQIIFGTLGFLTRKARRIADIRQMESLRQQAADLLNNS